MPFVVMTKVSRHPLFDPSNVVGDMIANSSLPSTTLMTLECIRLVVVVEATCLPHPPVLNRVPDPASRSMQLVVEVWGIFMPVDLRRRSSRNRTSPNVLPTCTPRECTPVAEVALETLPLARYLTAKVLSTPTAPIILIIPMITAPSPSVVVAAEISLVIIRASLE